MIEAISTIKIKRGACSCIALSKATHPLCCEFESLEGSGYRDRVSAIKFSHYCFVLTIRDKKNISILRMSWMINEYYFSYLAVRNEHILFLIKLG